MYASKATFMKIGKEIVLAEPIDIPTEIKVLQTFQEMCQINLQIKKTTVQEDRAILSDPAVSGNMKMSVTYRLE
jgi:hypothetical protein